MTLNSDAQAVLDQYGKFGVPPFESMSPANVRNAPTLKSAVEEMTAKRHTARATSDFKSSRQPVGKIDHLLIPGPAGDLLARVFTPPDSGPFPILVYFHGGGWVIANLDVYEPSCRALCNEIKCIVISVAYRLAPENRYPAAADDAYAATQWVISNAEKLGGISGQVAVAGESAGGNLATVVCMKARDQQGKMPVAQLLIYPVTDARMNTASYVEHANAKPLNAAMMRWFWMHYLGNMSWSGEQYASPLQATSLRGLPPAIVITAEIDPLRDEGEAYAHRLRAEGVSVEAHRFDGVMHEFFGMAGVVAKATEAVQTAAKGLRKIFERQTK